jgi:glycine/D-amino acid oxidase-like deaminating enzyme
VANDGLPLIGEVPGIAGAYVATGHSVWGVLNAPATGEATAELIVDGAARSTDLRPFDPARLRPLDPRLVR